MPHSKCFWGKLIRVSNTVQILVQSIDHWNISKFYYFWEFWKISRISCETIAALKSNLQDHKDVGSIMELLYICKDSYRYGRNTHTLNNFANQYNFWRSSDDVKMIFWFLYCFQIFKDQCGSVSSISVAVLDICKQ